MNGAHWLAASWHGTQLLCWIAWAIATFSLATTMTLYLEIRRFRRATHARRELLARLERHHPDNVAAILDAVDEIERRFRQRDEET